MSGWDVSSTPTWGSQDGPDETQTFTASGGGARSHGQEFGAPAFEGGHPGEGAPGSDYFGQDYGQEQDMPSGGYPQRTPGQSFQDLPRHDAALGRHGGMQDNGYGQDGGYGRGGSYGQDGPFGQDGGFPQDGFPQDGGFGQEWGGNGADQGGSWDHGGQDDGGWGRGAGPSAPPWDERPPRDADFGEADGGFGHQDFGGRQDFGRQPEGFSGHDYAGPDFPGQQDRGGQAPMNFGRQDRDLAARNDPALQDFFAPAGGGPGFSGQGEPGWSGGEPPRDRFRPADEEVDWTGRPKARPAEDPDVDWTGRPRGQRSAPRRDDDDDDEDSGGIGMKGLVAIGAVVVVVIAAAAYMFLHKGSSSTPSASSTPSGGTASSPAAKPSGHTGTAAGGGSAPAYTLVSPLPSKAGGYPLGQDPNDLANAKTTAQQIVKAVSTGGGGTVKGSPESGAYTLPLNQAMTFVGYQGTFSPTKVKAIINSLGTDPNTYPAGTDGGVLGCVNTTTTPSGAVCVWATSSTLGITEFYSATGPETLNAAQPKGASDTVKFRADVEKKA